MPQNSKNLTKAIKKIKESIEGAIISGGTEAKNNLIRSQKPIQLLHEVVKSELIRLKVNKKCISPTSGKSSGELDLSGFLKRKNQDLCVTPKNIEKRSEKLKFEG